MYDAVRYLFQTKVLWWLGISDIQNALKAPKNEEAIGPDFEALIITDAPDSSFHQITMGCAHCFREIQARNSEQSCTKFRISSKTEFEPQTSI